jgi:4-amino-4-deoxy-L-arabinose transferase-like glycosyltransferase
MLFLLPSILFWTSDVSKEAVMMLALGVSTLGAARVLARRRRGYPVMLLGIAMGIATRPDEFALLLAGFTVALFFRRRDERRQLRTVRRLSTLIFLGAILALTAVLTVKFVHGNSASVSTLLHKAHKNNTGAGAGFGSSNVPYSSDPLLYPRDLYTVLFDPLPITARSITQGLAALENTVILVLVLGSLRRLRLTFRAGRERPYVILCAVYSAAFVYIFAALGNLGLITRERTLLFPYLLVLLAIPLTPKGEPPAYAWEKPRETRKQRRAAAVRAAEFPARLNT